jgi:hypothetical protein
MFDLFLTIRTRQHRVPPLQVLFHANQNTPHTFKEAEFISKQISRATYPSYVRKMQLTGSAVGKPGSHFDYCQMAV